MITMIHSLTVYKWQQNKSRVVFNSTVHLSIPGPDLWRRCSVWRCVDPACVVWAVLRIGRLDRRQSLVRPHLTRPAVLVHQALGALPVLAVLSSPTSSEGVWTWEVRNSVRTTPTRILTANLTEEVWSVETPPRHGEGAALSEAEISQTLASPEGTALRVPAAAGSLERQIAVLTLFTEISQPTGVPKNNASENWR